MGVDSSPDTRKEVTRPPPAPEKGPGALTPFTENEDGEYRYHDVGTDGLVRLGGGVCRPFERQHHQGDECRTTGRGGCDYTGWDCQASNNMTVCATRNDAILFGMSEAEAERLGLLHERAAS